MGVLLCLLCWVIIKSLAGFLDVSYDFSASERRPQAKAGPYGSRGDLGDKVFM